jgi:hypothetical protein
MCTSDTEITTHTHTHTHTPKKMFYRKIKMHEEPQQSDRQSRPVLKHKIRKTYEAGRYSAALLQFRLSVKAQVACIPRHTSLGKNYTVALRLEAGGCGRVSANRSGLRGEEEIPVRTRNAEHSLSLH